MLTTEEREAAAKQAEGYPKGHGHDWGVILETGRPAQLHDLLRGMPGYG